MVELTQAAKNQIDGYFADKEKSSIRIFLSTGGCSGVGLALALDQAGESDEVVEAGGYSFVIEKNLYAEAKPVKIDLNHMGFQIESSLVLPESTGGCSGCGGGCGH